MYKKEVRERIILLRVELIKDENGRKYSRDKFAEILGLKGGVIENIEYGLAPIKEYVIKLISKIFGVNENWIKNGTEPIFIKEKEIDLIEELKRKYNLTDISTSIISAFTKLDKEKQITITDFMINFVNDYYTNNPDKITNLNNKLNEVIKITKEKGENEKS